MGTPACPNYADRVIPYEVTEATAFSAFLPTTWAPGPHNSPVRIVPLSAPPGSGPGPAPAPGRWPHRAHAQDRVGRRHAPARVRAAHAAREAGRAHPRPRINLVLYHGVLAPHAGWRSRVVAYGAAPVEAPAGASASANGKDDS